MFLSLYIYGVIQLDHHKFLLNLKHFQLRRTQFGLQPVKSPENSRRVKRRVTLKHIHTVKVTICGGRQLQLTLKKSVKTHSCETTVRMRAMSFLILTRKFKLSTYDQRPCQKRSFFILPPFISIENLNILTHAVLWAIITQLYLRKYLDRIYYVPTQFIRVPI